MRTTVARGVAAFVAVALTIGFAGCASTSDATGESGDGGANTLKISMTPSLTNLPLYVADAEGIWEKHDVQPSYVNIGSAPEAAAAFTSGDLHVANLLSNAVIPLVDQGAELTVIGKNPHNSILDVLVRSDYDLPADASWQEVMQALEGSNVGVVAKGSGVEAYARTLFEEAGVDPDAQTYIATGLPSTTLAALSSGKIDMTVTFEPGLTQAVEEGIATRPFSLMADEGPSVLHAAGGLMASPTEFVDGNEDLLRRYLAAYDEALAWIKDDANRDEVLAIIEEKLQVDSDLAAAMLDNNLSGYPDEARLEDADIQRLDEVTTYLAEEGTISSDLESDDWLRVVD
jgi:NitT/TauT family transport system substrate-binding protein